MDELIVASGLSSTQSPTIHSSSLNRSYGGMSSAGAGRSRISAIRQTSPDRTMSAANPLMIEGSLGAVSFEVPSTCTTSGVRNRVVSAVVSSSRPTVRQTLRKLPDDRLLAAHHDSVQVDQRRIVGEEISNSRDVPLIQHLRITRQSLSDDLHCRGSSRLRITRILRGQRRASLTI